VVIEDGTHPQVAPGRLSSGNSPQTSRRRNHMKRYVATKILKTVKVYSCTSKQAKGKANCG
jgi:hypothetical protein